MIDIECMPLQTANALKTTKTMRVEKDTTENAGITGDKTESILQKATRAYATIASIATGRLSPIAFSIHILLKVLFISDYIIVVISSKLQKSTHLYTMLNTTCAQQDIVLNINKTNTCTKYQQ